MTETSHTETSNHNDNEKNYKVDWFKRTTDSLTVLVIASGFFLTLSQVGRWQEANDLQAWNSTSLKWLEVDQFFIVNADIREYFYEGKNIEENNQNYAKVTSSAIYVLNFMDYVVSTSKHIVNRYPETKSFIQPNVWEEYLRLTYLTSPVVCRTLYKYRSGYSSGLRDIARIPCAKLMVNLE